MTVTSKTVGQTYQTWFGNGIIHMTYPRSLLVGVFSALKKLLANLSRLVSGPKISGSKIFEIDITPATRPMCSNVYSLDFNNF